MILFSIFHKKLIVLYYIAIMNNLPNELIYKIMIYTNDVDLIHEFCGFNEYKKVIKVSINKMYETRTYHVFITHQDTKLYIGHSKNYTDVINVCKYGQLCYDPMLGWHRVLLCAYYGGIGSYDKSDYYCIMCPLFDQFYGSICRIGVAKDKYSYKVGLHHIHKCNKNQYCKLKHALLKHNIAIY